MHFGQAQTSKNPSNPICLTSLGTSRPLPPVFRVRIQPSSYEWITISLVLIRLGQFNELCKSLPCNILDYTTRDQSFIT